MEFLVLFILKIRVILSMAFSAHCRALLAAATLSLVALQTTVFFSKGGSSEGPQYPNLSVEAIRHSGLRRKYAGVTTAVSPPTAVIPPVTTTADQPTPSRPDRLFATLANITGPEQLSTTTPILTRSAFLARVPEGR